MVQKSLRRTWSGHLVGAHGRGTWWGHLVGTPGGDTSYQHESSGSGGGSSRLPTPQTGNMITHTHSHYTHTPKDIIRTQKINLLGKKKKNERKKESKGGPYILLSNPMVGHRFPRGWAWDVIFGGPRGQWWAIDFIKKSNGGP